MANPSAPMPELAAKICNRIQSVFSTPDHRPSPLAVVLHELAAAAARNARVFVHGVGREGLMMRALCMRLTHLGLSAHVVGDVTAPSIAAGDLLAASAGPGGFPTVDAICGVARSAGARVLLLTARPDGSTSAFASAVAHVAGQTVADEGGVEGKGEEGLLLPMGSLYEGALFVLFEMVVYKLALVLGQTPDMLTARHTNLE